ncbi:MBL fold metallo-hydrolase [Thermoleophilia bacterium SCSIO 60948]|nr:MBL fold metallo-hydrolase [Thermoleophilia bacterium SCSIO 60948]
MLEQVADGVWVRQSEWVWTNSTIVSVDDGLILIDPGIHGAELESLADEIERIGRPVIAGFSTHPHFDHLLWHSRFGDAPRYATGEGARFAAETIEQQREGTAEAATAAPLELVGLVEPLPDGGGPVPGELTEHSAHCVGHAAVLLTDRGVLIAGDTLSDILVPIFDPFQNDQLAAFETALERLEPAVERAEVLIPGHGGVARGDEVGARFEAERAYVEALRGGTEPTDARLEADWVVAIHDSNLAKVRGG